MFFQMKNIADNLSLILYILSGQGPEYESVAINVTERQDSLSFEEIQFLLLNQDQHK